MQTGGAWLRAHPAAATAVRVPDCDRYLGPCLKNGAAAARKFALLRRPLKKAVNVPLARGPHTERRP